MTMLAQGDGRCQTTDACTDNQDAKAISSGFAVDFCDRHFAGTVLRNSN
jgi:hypothetical protein